MKTITIEEAIQRSRRRLDDDWPIVEAYRAHAIANLPNLLNALEPFLSIETDDDGNEGEWRDGLFYPGVPDHVALARAAHARATKVDVQG